MNCPNCGEKAAYLSTMTSKGDKQVPSLDGIASCPQCGYSKAHRFSANDYYFKLQVGGKTLYARSLNNLKEIRNWFSDENRGYLSPEDDFPKVFYINRKVLLKRIEKMIKANSQ